MLLALGFSLAALPASASAADCAPVAPAAGVSALPKAWRAAIEELQAATSQPGKPWSCVGGTVELSLKAGGSGTLIVRTADGIAIERVVDAPEDVTPLGEAMLAKPASPRPAEPVEVPAPPPIDDPPSSDAAPAIEAHAPVVSTTSGATSSIGPDAVPVEEPLSDPKVVVGAMVGPRYAGKSELAMGSALVGVGIPVARWVPGAWIRFDGPFDVDRRAVPFVEVCLGGAFGRVFSAGPVDITPSVTGSAAIVVEHTQAHQETRYVDGRLGANVHVSLPRKSLFRAAFSADFEIAPAQFDDGPPPKTTDVAHATLPSYTLGVGVGVELAPR